MIELVPQDNGTVRITGLPAAERFFEPRACQARVAMVGEIIEALGDDEAEMDMSDRMTSDALRIMSMSVTDHFLICDFDMAVSLGETVLELDPEDRCGVLGALVYSYAMLGDAEAVEELLPFMDAKEPEKELVRAVLSFRRGDAEIALSDELKAILADPLSDLSERTAHLWIEIPLFKNLLKK